MVDARVATGLDDDELAVSPLAELTEGADLM